MKSKVELIQDELKKAVGPIGSFIVEKQIKDMNESKDNFPDDKLPILIERSVENGIFDPESGRRFREQVLARGGSRDAMSLYVAFRGREPDIDALLRHSGLAA